MRRMRWLLAMLLAFSMIAAACGDSDDSSDDGGTDTTADGGSSDDGGDAMEVVTGDGVDGNVIRVGLNADLSGPFAALVSEIVEGQEVYWEVFNENGGYAEMSVDGQSDECEEVKKVFNTVDYCPASCGANPNLPECANCGNGGSGQFGKPIPEGP